MKIGCYCKTEQIAAMAELGYDYVELSAAGLLNMSGDEFSQTRRILKQSNIPCLAAGDYCADRPAITGEGFDRQAAADYAARICERVYELGARRIGVGSPLARTMPVKYPYYRAAEQAVEFFRIAGEAALPYEGLEVLIEALNFNSCNFCNTQQQALDLVRRVGLPNVRLEVDFFHMLMMAEPFERFCDICPMTGHVHLSGRDAHDGRRFFADEDWEICHKAASVMKAAGYEGTVSIEVPLELFCVQGAGKSLAMLRQALE